MSDNESRLSGGSYRDRLKNAAEADIADLENPWNFFQSVYVGRQDHQHVV